MTRDASGCMMCHLTGLYGLEREKTYDSWLLKLIKDHGEQTRKVIPFSKFRTFLSFENLLTSLDIEDLKDCWKVITTNADPLFSGVQFELDLVSGSGPAVWLEWKDQVDQPFQILVDVSLPQIQNGPNKNQAASFDRLKTLMFQVFDLAALPVDAIRCVNGDFLWQEANNPSRIVPQNHYVHRHIRSALDRIHAPLALVLQTQGSFTDVRDYWSDGQNEVQLAGSTQFGEIVLHSINNGDVRELTSLTDQFRSISMETTYFHSLNPAGQAVNQFSTSQLIACWQILLSVTGSSAVNVASLMNAFLTQGEQDAKISLAEKLEKVFSNPAFKPLSKLLAFRLQNSAFHPLGAQISMPSTPSIWAVQRFSPDMVDTVLCLVNSSSQTQEITLGDQDLQAGSQWQDFRGGKILKAGEPWRLQPYEGLWLIPSED